MKITKEVIFLTLLFLAASAAHAQFLGIAGGRNLPRDLGRGSQGGSQERSEFPHGGYFSLDVGMRAFPFVTMGVHYSSAGSDLRLNRGDSRAERVMNLKIKLWGAPYRKRIFLQSTREFRKPWLMAF